MRKKHSPYPKNHIVPLGFLDIFELTECFMYKYVTETIRAIKNGSFPIPTMKLRGKHVALRSVVRAYFELQTEAAMLIVNKEQAKIDGMLITRAERRAKEGKLQQRSKNLATEIERRMQRKAKKRLATERNLIAQTLRAHDPSLKPAKAVRLSRAMQGTPWRDTPSLEKPQVDAEPLGAVIRELGSEDGVTDVMRALMKDHGRVKRVLVEGEEGPADAEGIVIVTK